MNKKILATLLIASIAITGLFATNNAILNANKPDSNYTFIIQYNNAGTTESAEVNGLTLNKTEQTTGNAFSIVTSAKGNVHKGLTFTTTVVTGPFIGLATNANGSETTNAFPAIKYTADDVTVSLSGTEAFSYAPITTVGTAFEVLSTGTFTRTFRPGVHPIYTPIAHFKLSFKGNDSVVAGNYTSTTTVEIATT